MSICQKDIKSWLKFPVEDPLKSYLAQESVPVIKNDRESIVQFHLPAEMPVILGPHQNMKQKLDILGEETSVMLVPQDRLNSVPYSPNEKLMDNLTRHGSHGHEQPIVSNCQVLGVVKPSISFEPEKPLTITIEGKEPYVMSIMDKGEPEMGIICKEQPMKLVLVEEKLVIPAEHEELPEMSIQAEENLGIATKYEELPVMLIQAEKKVVVPTEHEELPVMPIQAEKKIMTSTKHEEQLLKAVVHVEHLRVTTGDEESLLMTIKQENQHEMFIEQTGQAEKTIEHTGQRQPEKKIDYPVQPEKTFEHVGELLMTIKQEKQPEMTTEHTEQPEKIFEHTGQQRIIIEHTGQLWMTIKQEKQPELTVEQPMMTIEYKEELVIPVEHEDLPVNKIVIREQHVGIIRHEEEFMVTTELEKPNEHEGEATTVEENNEMYTKTIINENNKPSGQGMLEEKPLVNFSKENCLMPVGQQDMEVEGNEISKSIPINNVMVMPVSTPIEEPSSYQVINDEMNSKSDMPGKNCSFLSKYSFKFYNYWYDFMVTLCLSSLTPPNSF